MVDGGGLENHCGGNSTGGSNPSPSAKLRSRSFGGVRRFLVHRATHALAFVATWLEFLSANLQFVRSCEQIERLSENQRKRSAVDHWLLQWSGYH